MGRWQFWVNNMGEETGELEFASKDLREAEVLARKGASQKFVRFANIALAEVIGAVMDELPWGVSKEEILQAGLSGKLPESQRRDAAKGGLAGTGGGQIRFRQETVTVESKIKMLPPVTIMVLVEADPVFGIQTEKMAGGAGVLKWAKGLNSPEIISSLIPGIATSETKLFVQLSERKVSGVAEELEVVESGDKEGGGALLRKYISAIHDPVGKSVGIGLGWPSFEDSIARFGKRAKLEREKGRFPLVVVGMDMYLEPDATRAKKSGWGWNHVLSDLPKPMVYVNLRTDQVNPFALTY